MKIRERAVPATGHVSEGADGSTGIDPVPGRLIHRFCFVGASHALNGAHDGREREVHRHLLFLDRAIRAAPLAVARRLGHAD